MVVAVTGLAPQAPAALPFVVSQMVAGAAARVTTGRCSSSTRLPYFSAGYSLAVPKSHGSSPARHAVQVQVPVGVDAGVARRRPKLGGGLARNACDGAAPHARRRVGSRRVPIGIGGRSTQFVAHQAARPARSVSGCRGDAGGEGRGDARSLITHQAAGVCAACDVAGVRGVVGRGSVPSGVGRAHTTLNVSHQAAREGAAVVLGRGGCRGGPARVGRAHASTNGYVTNQSAGIGEKSGQSDGIRISRHVGEGVARDDIASRFANQSAYVRDLISRRESDGIPRPTLRPAPGR